MRKAIGLTLCAFIGAGACTAARVAPPAPPPPSITSELATILVSYAAVHVCSCLFVSGRALESCDLDPAAEPLVALKVDRDRVTATVGSLATGRARFEPGYGCAIEKEAAQ
jgi:hypothetical protein